MTGRRLLVVDDEDFICDLVRNVAEPMGFEVRACLRSLDFARVYEEFAPTDIVLDIVMPEQDGMEIMRWLAARRSTARITVMTGFNPRYIEFAKSLAAGNGLGAIRSLAKPVHIATLRAHLRAEA